MYTISIEKECSCFKKENTELPGPFQTLAEAEMAAFRLTNHMNATWCKKHRFFVTQDENQLMIRLELSCPSEPV